MRRFPSRSYDEVRRGKDLLATWCKTPEVKEALRFSEEPDVELVRQVVRDGYAPDLTDDEAAKFGRDPFLVAYCLVEVDRRCVVTTEVSKPSRTRANRRLPDVCADLGVRCCTAFEFLRELDFRTSWR